MAREYNTLVYSGGGIRGLAYVGIFKKIEELISERRIEECKLDFSPDTCSVPLLNIKTVCAVSVGSIFSLIYLLKFTYVEMLEEVLHKKFDQLKDIRIMNFVGKYGLDSGVNLVLWIQSLMTRKGINYDISFKDFQALNGVDFQVMATNLNKYCYKKFNYIDTPDTKVLDAIRMSISIPFVFTINEYDGDIHVDGGLIDNYPIKMFKTELDNVLGFKLINNGEMESHCVDERIDDIESYIYHVLSCYVVQKEKHTSSDEYKKCTVYIHTENITQSINFSLTPLEKHRLIEMGYKSLCTFLDNANTSS